MDREGTVRSKGGEFVRCLGIYGSGLIEFVSNFETGASDRLGLLPFLRALLALRSVPSLGSLTFIARCRYLLP